MAGLDPNNHRRKYPFEKLKEFAKYIGGRLKLKTCPSAALDPNNFQWDDANKSLFIGYLKRMNEGGPLVEAWVTFTVISFNKGNTEAAPSLLYRLQMRGDKIYEDNVDITTMPAGIPRDIKLWPATCAELWVMKYQEHIKKEQAWRVAEASRKEKQQGKTQPNDRNPFEVITRKAVEQDKVLESQLSGAKQELPKYIGGRLKLQTSPSAGLIFKMRNLRSLCRLKFFKAFR